MSVFVSLGVGVEGEETVELPWCVNTWTYASWSWHHYQQGHILNSHAHFDSYEQFGLGYLCQKHSRQFPLSSSVSVFYARKFVVEGAMRKILPRDHHNWCSLSRVTSKLLFELRDFSKAKESAVLQFNHTEYGLYIYLNYLRYILYVYSIRNMNNEKGMFEWRGSACK